MKVFIRDTVYLAVFLAVFGANSWALATGFAPGGLVPLLVLLQGLMFVGLMELFHQAVHLNLHRSRALNLILGRLAGAHLGLGFVAYRRFHLAHHNNTNTADDPERDFYQTPASTTGLWLYPFIYLFRNAGVINQGKYLRAEDRLGHRVDLVSILVFRAASIALTVVYPWPMLMAYWLPYFVFFYIELYMSQSQHFFSAEARQAPRGLEHYAASVNITLPFPLGFLCLYTNEHATHHVKASVKWYDTPAKTREDAAYVCSIPAIAFLKVLFSEGAKQWTPTPELTPPGNAPLTQQ